MKAVINGIEVEGTPDEIVEYQRLVEEDKYEKAYHDIMTPYFNPFIFHGFQVKLFGSDTE